MCDSSIVCFLREKVFGVTRLGRWRLKVPPTWDWQEFNGEVAMLFSGEFGLKSEATSSNYKFGTVGFGSISRFLRIFCCILAVCGRYVGNRMSRMSLAEGSTLI